MVSITRCNASHKQAGFTITELMVTISIMAILAGLSASFQDLIFSHRVKNAGFELFASLTFARSEAVTRNLNVTITPSAFGWARGWTITDQNGVVVRQYQGLGNITVTGPASVTYGSNGRLIATVTPFQLNGGTASQVRCISIDLSGLPVTKPVSCA